MECKKKTLRRSEWHRVTKRTEAYIRIQNAILSGKAGLLQIQELLAPLWVESPQGKMKIADCGYFWMQIAPEEKHWWLTVMFDSNGKLLQSYFDITRENHIQDTMESYFIDLFLDVFIPAYKSPVILDRDELDDALRVALITESEHQMALYTADQIMEWYAQHTEMYYVYIKKLFAALQKHLPVNTEL